MQYIIQLIRIIHNTGGWILYYFVLLGLQPEPEPEAAAAVCYHYQCPHVSGRIWPPKTVNSFVSKVLPRKIVLLRATCLAGAMASAGALPSLPCPVGGEGARCPHGIALLNVF
jgi:hypothetical protein